MTQSRTIRTAVSALMMTVPLFNRSVAFQACSSSPAGVLRLSQSCSSSSCSSRLFDKPVSGENFDANEPSDDRPTKKPHPPKEMEAYSAAFLEDNGLTITTDDEGRITARPPTQMVAYQREQQQRQQRQQPQQQQQSKKKELKEQPAQVVPPSGYNVVLTHCTADFDSLASAVGLARIWSSNELDGDDGDDGDLLPTFVVLPRGAHPGVQRFLSLHKHLFPIRSLKSLPQTGLNRLGLVDAQRRDRVGPAEPLLGLAKRVTVVDHHVDSESDIPEATDYVVDQVGSVTTLIVEQLQQANLELSEAEATLMALGIHADTGSLCFDSTTPRDAYALAWTLQQGASQAAIAEHVQSSLSSEQQGVLTQALMNANSTVLHGVTVSTVLLSADGFINGLAAVAQDALEMSSSEVFLLALVYEAARSTRRKHKRVPGTLHSRLLKGSTSALTTLPAFDSEGWMGGEEALRRRRLRAAFDRRDTDGSGYLERNEIAQALSTSGIIVTEDTINGLMQYIDKDGDGRIDFEEFVSFSNDADNIQKQEADEKGKRPSTMIIIGRAKAGVNLKAVRLNKLMEEFGGGGHPKAASCTVRLADESEAEGVLQGMVDDLLENSLSSQLVVGDFMTAPVLSAQPHMTEKEVETLFLRYDVRALPVVDDDNEVIGLVTYKEVAAAKQRLWNKEQKRLRQEAEQEQNKKKPTDAAGERIAKQRKRGSALKGWMKQHITTVPDDMTMAEVEALLLENDVGCIPVVASGTNKLVGMVTRTDLLRQHRYYPSLHYHNKGFADSIAARKPIIELRRRLKKFDIENE